MNIHRCYQHQTCCCSLSSSDTGTSSPTVQSPVPTMDRVTHSDSIANNASDDEEHLEKIFSQSYQQEQEQQKTKNYTIVDTLSAKVQALSESESVAKKTKEELTDEGG